MVVYWVDLGYHVTELHNNFEDAQTACDNLNKEAKDTQIKDLMTGCRYTLCEAQEWMSRHRDYYSMEEVELSQGNNSRNYHEN